MVRQKKYIVIIKCLFNDFNWVVDVLSNFQQYFSYIIAVRDNG